MVGENLGLGIISQICYNEKTSGGRKINLPAAKNKKEIIIMCLLMGPQVIINNAFLAKKGTQPFLEISALRKFCNILYDRITGSSERGGGYKYVLFQVSEADVERFCDRDDQFVRGIDKVFCTREVEAEKVERINSIYASEIQGMLREAREAFAKS